MTDTNSTEKATVHATTNGVKTESWFEGRDAHDKADRNADYKQRMGWDDVRVTKR